MTNTYTLRARLWAATSEDGQTGARDLTTAAHQPFAMSGASASIVLRNGYRLRPEACQRERLH